MDYKNTSEIFYNFAVGFGAIGGGLFAFIKLLVSFLSNLKRNSYKKTIMNMYPRKKLNQTFKIVDTEEKPGLIYLVDLEKNEKHWIQSAPTLLDLNFNWNDTQRITQKEFDSFKEEQGILTSGNPGS